MANKYDSPRSIRIDEKTWAAARRKATLDGTTISGVIVELVKGYADGKIKRPTVKLVYDDSPAGK